MATLGTVTAKIAVKHTIAVGPTMVAGGGVTLAAYALAIVAYVQGARDEATMSAIVVGTLSLVTTLIGRYGQAIVATLKLAEKMPGASPAIAQVPSVQQPVATAASATGTNVTWTSPRPGASISNTPATPAAAPPASEPPAPFTPDGDPADDPNADNDPLAQAPDESWIADPKDTAGGDDHPEGGPA